MSRSVFASDAPGTRLGRRRSARDGRPPGRRAVWRGRGGLAALAALALLVPLAAASLAAPATAAQPGRAQPAEPGYTAVTVHSPDPQPNGRWAERSATAGDLNGDGVNDLWVGVPKADGTGRVYALNGAALPGGQADVPYTIDSPEPQDGTTSASSSPTSATSTATVSRISWSARRRPNQNQGVLIVFVSGRG